MNTPKTDSEIGKNLSTPALLLADESASTSDVLSHELGWVQLLTLCLPAMALTFAVTIYAPLVDRLKANYGVTTVVYNLNITFALGAIAVGGLLITPLLEAMGKKRAFLSTWLLFIIFNIGSAFVNNLGGLVVLRMIAFIFGGPAVFLLFTEIANCSNLHRQHLYFSIATMLSLLGLVMGPVAGGLIEGNHGNNSPDWSRYSIPIICFAFILPYATFAASSRQQAPSTPPRQVKVSYRETLKMFVTFNIKEPIVIGITLYLSQLYFFLLVTLGAFPYAFGQIRGYTTSEVALTYLSLVIGVLLSMLMTLVSPLLKRTQSQVSFGDKDSQPEQLLTGFLLCGPLIPIGLFLFAWTATSTSTHWIAPMIGMILFSFSSSVAFTDLNAYLSKVYGSNASTAIACPLVSQLLTASIAPLLTLFMIQRVTFGGSLSILSGVILGLTFIPYLLWWKGKQLRHRSTYARM